MLYIIIFLIIAFLLSLIPISNTDKNQIKKQIIQQDKLNKLINENVIEKSNFYINNEFTKAIVIDEVNTKVNLFSTSNNSCRIYNFDDVIQSEVIIDNSTVTKTNRSKQVVGSVVGGAIAGVPGMIIGGLSGEQITTEKIKSIELKLTLNDLDNPIFKINFSPISNKSFSKDSPQVRNAITSIDRWHGIFNVILKQQNKAI